MNKVLLTAGILSATVAIGQTTQTTRSSSTTSNTTSNYNNSNTNNYNTNNANRSSNAALSTGTSNTGVSGSMSSGTTGTYNSNGTYNNSTSVTPSGSNNYNTMSTSGAATTTPTEPYSNTYTGATGTTGTYNSNGTYNNSTSVTPSGSSNYNTMGTSGATSTPSTTYDNNTGTSTMNSTSTYSTSSRRDPDPAGRNGYNNFAFGIYAGLNATNLRGEAVNTENPSSRLGYQLGLFLRGGGRLYGQIGAEYFASSSNYFRAGNASSSQAIRDYINVQYIQVPVYIGYKLTQSERGNSAIRVQVGAEYANRISSDSRSFNLSGSEIKTGSFNALGQLGFDFGPFLIDLTYHHGLSDAVQINTFQGSTRRILSASVGFKF